MFEKNLRIAYLLDFYDSLFDERTRAILRAYYEDDLSLAEIADGEKISRQGVRHIIKKAEEDLLFWEDRLHLASDFSAIREQVAVLRAVRDELGKHRDPAVRAQAETLSGAIESILAKAL